MDIGFDLSHRWGGYSDSVTAPVQPVRVGFGVCDNDYGGGYDRGCIFIKCAYRFGEVIHGKGSGCVVVSVPSGDKWECWL